MRRKHLDEEEINELNSWLNAQDPVFPKKTLEDAYLKGYENAMKRITLGMAKNLRSSAKELEVIASQKLD